jgi:hypothetical protein
MRARPAESLADAFGVVVHFHFQESAYAHVERVVDTVLDLGARHVRSLLSRLPSTTAGFRALADGGVAIEAVCGTFGSSETMNSILRRAVDQYDDPTTVFSAFEGINEPNNDGLPWVAETRRKVQGLHDARSLYGLQDVPIVAPSLARVNSGGVQGGDTEGQSQALGDLTEWIDRGNIHVYPRGRQPSTDIDEFVEYQRAVCGDLPIRCTEGGYFTAENYVGGAFATPEQVVRQYLPRQLLEHWTRGVDRFFCYELLDDPDPARAEREASFGMLAVAGAGADDVWTPKGQYDAMRNLLALLSDPGAGTPPDSLRMLVTPCDADLRNVLLAKRDGTFLLLLWRDVSIYDPTTDRLIEVEPRNVRVALAEAARLQVFYPSTQRDPLRIVGPAASIEIPVSGELVALAIAPAAGTAAAIR